MLTSFLSHANYWAILVATLAYFVLGSLWFSALFGKVWSKEVEKHGVKINEPAKSDIAKKMLQTFTCNALAAISIAYVIFATGAPTWLAGAKLGLLCGIGFAAVGISIAYTWESRSAKLLAIDCGYAVAGITICGIIIGAWQ
jgi:hypothetical protein